MNVVLAYSDIMARFQAEFGPDSILAGGAVRDALFNIPVKDLDFLTRSVIDLSNINHVAQLKRVFPDDEFTTIYNSQENTEEYPDVDTIELTLENADKTINIMCVAEIMPHIDQFPDSISQVWFDGKLVHFKPAWLDVIGSGVVYYTDRLTDERMTKLMRKYPDMTWEKIIDS